MDTTLNRFRKKLERWELEHLRQHASDLAARLELAEERAHKEATNADFWQDRAEEIWRDLTGQGAMLGLTMDGRVIALVNHDLVIDALGRSERFLIGFEDDEENTEAKLSLTSVRAAISALEGEQS